MDANILMIPRHPIENKLVQFIVPLSLPWNKRNRYINLSQGTVKTIYSRNEMDEQYWAANIAIE